MLWAYLTLIVFDHTLLHNRSQHYYLSSRFGIVHFASQWHQLYMYILFIKPISHPVFFFFFKEMLKWNLLFCKLKKKKKIDSAVNGGFYYKYTELFYYQYITAYNEKNK